MHIVPDDRPEPPPQQSFDEKLWEFVVRAWWLGPALVILGWAPLFVADIIEETGHLDRLKAIGLGMGLGMGVGFPLTILAVGLMAVQVIRVLYRIVTGKLRFPT
jgi:hypothetical protein